MVVGKEWSKRSVDKYGFSIGVRKDVCYVSCFKAVVDGYEREDQPLVSLQVSPCAC